MFTIGEDVRFGLRVLRNNPGFTAVAVFTLALGIAANTTVFSWVDGLLLHPFPGSTGSDRLAVLEMNTGAPSGGIQMSWLDRRDYQRSLKSLAGIALQREDVFNLGEGTNIQAVWGQFVSGNYFAVLGLRPELGRVFTNEEDGDKLGAYPVAVISHWLWRSRFHSDPKTVGRSVRINGRLLTIVGVTPPEFCGAMPGMLFQIWVPATMGPQLGRFYDSFVGSRGYRDMYGLVRLKPGVSVAQARAEVMSAASNLATAYPQSNRGVSATVEPPWRFRSAAPDLLLGPLKVLMAVSLLVLLIVCANVANLLLARSIARQREFGIRLALGATRVRLVRQVMIETLMLSAGGALAGWALASFMADSLIALLPAHIGVPLPTSSPLGGHSLAFTILCCVSATLIAGAIPALFTARSDVNETLREGGRGGTVGAGSHRTRGLLVIAEVALSVVALVGAGLFARSLRNARSMYPGFDKNHVLVARMFIASAGYTDKDVTRFLFNLRQRMEATPGITDVSYAEYVPLSSTAGPWDDFWVQGYVPAPGESMTVSRITTAPGYFRLLRIPLLAGRDIREDDTQQTAQVCLVNKAFAQRYFRGENPIGRKILLDNASTTVIGLTGDIKYSGITEASHPVVFTPFNQRWWLGANILFILRTTGDPLTAVSALRREAAAINPNAASLATAPLEDWMQMTMLPVKMAASMLGAMAMLSLILAAVGLYSVMAYAVSQRTQEIGIRMALGAMPRNVLGEVLLRGLTLTGAGLMLGTLGALAVTRVVSSMLVGVGSNDPLTFAAAAAFLTAIGLLASYLPARRATKVDPVVALRRE